jgi:hypothetical protein
MDEYILKPNTKRIQLEFIAERKWYSFIINWFTSGSFSHVDFVVASQYRFGARPCGGVALRKVGYVPVRRTLIVTIDCNDTEYALFREFLEKQVRKPYDYKGIFGFALGRAWFDDSRWFCSELIAAALIHAGILRPLCVPANRISPNALLLVLSAVMKV